MKIVFAILASCFMFLSFTDGLETEDWDLVKDKDGVKIYTREVEGKPVKALKIESIIRGQSLSSFVATFKALDSYENWVYSIAETKLLKRISENELVYYSRSDFPWPLEDRDFVIKNKSWQDSVSYSFHSNSVIYNDYLDENEDCIRVKEFAAAWVIKPLTSGDFELEYTFITDPGGSVPTWIVNSFLEVGPLKTIKALEKEASSEKYKDVKFSFIRELGE